MKKKHIYLSDSLPESYLSLVNSIDDSDPAVSVENILAIPQLSEFEEQSKEQIKEILEGKSLAVECLKIYLSNSEFSDKINEALWKSDTGDYSPYLVTLFSNLGELDKHLAKGGVSVQLSGLIKEDTRKTYFQKGKKLYFSQFIRAATDRKKSKKRLEALLLQKKEEGDVTVFFDIKLYSRNLWNKYKVLGKSTSDILFLPFFTFNIIAVEMDEIKISNRYLSFYKILVEEVSEQIYWSKLRAAKYEERSSNAFPVPDNIEFVDLSEEEVHVIQPADNSDDDWNPTFVPVDENGIPLGEGNAQESGGIDNALPYYGAVANPGGGFHMISPSLYVDVPQTRVFPSQPLIGYTAESIAEKYTNKILNVYGNEPQIKYPEEVVSELRKNKDLKGAERTIQHMLRANPAIDSLKLYTTEEGRFYSVLNGALANGKFETFIPYLLALLSHERDLEKYTLIPSTVVYRGSGIKEEEISKNYMVGKKLYSKSFLSTSMNKNTALGFISKSKDLIPVFIKIHLNSSVRWNKYSLEEISMFHNEKEILLLPYFHFEVIIKKDKLHPQYGKYLYLELKELDTSLYGKTKELQAPTQMLAIQLPCPSSPRSWLEEAKNSAILYHKDGSSQLNPRSEPYNYNPSIHQSDKNVPVGIKCCCCACCYCCSCCSCCYLI